MPADSVLSGTGLGVFRGERWLFRGLNFALRGGDLLHLRGANGSGKTTLLRVVAGLSRRDEGQVLLREAPVDDQYSLLHQELSWYGHRDGLKESLTGRENLLFFARLRGVSAGDANSVAERLGVDGILDLRVGFYSAGQRRRLALCRLLLVPAKIWLLDEPFTNLDVGGQQRVAEVVTRHLNDGGCCMLAAHQKLDTHFENHQELQMETFG